jgi:hypothetical protein
MSEQAPQVVQTPEQIQSDETMAHAMKPEMDVMAHDRAIAPKTGALAMRDGQVTLVEVPNLSPTQLEEHAVRKEYANRDATAALKAEEVLNDPSANAKDIVRAHQDLKNLLSPERKPRPKEQIARISDNRQVV